jgi:hypothetical protein
MLSFFNAEQSSPFGSPQSAMDIVISSFIFAFFGVMMFIGSVRYEQTYDKAATWWKWSFLPIGIGILLGIQKVAFLTSYGYVNTVLTKKLLWSHYLALIIPVLCVVSIILYKRMKQRTEERRVY